MENNEVIRITNKMFKKSYMSRWYFYLAYLPAFLIMYSFTGFIFAIIISTIIITILFSVLFSTRLALKSHVNYNCPHCNYNMSFIHQSNEAVLSDASHKGRCPQCAKYHIVDYVYEGTMSNEEITSISEETIKTDTKKHSIPVETKYYKNHEIKK